MHKPICWFIALAFSTPLLAAPPISYQGHLKISEEPYSGPPVEMIFRLFESESGTDQIGQDIEKTVSVSDGLFQVELNFGLEAFDGQPRFLEISIGEDVLVPRQAVTVSPLALYALSGNEGPPGEDGTIVTAGTGLLLNEGEVLIDQDYLDGLYLGASGGSADGPIIAPDFEYSEALVRTRTFPVSVFLAEGSLWNLADDNAHYGFRGSQSGYNRPAKLTAPVQLPDDARIIAAYCYVYDSHSTRGIDVSMRITRSNLGADLSGDPTVLLWTSLETSGASTQLRELGSAELDEVVDNSQSAIHLTLSFFTEYGGESHRFYGCKIDFEVDSPAP